MAGLRGLISVLDGMLAITQYDGCTHDRLTNVKLREGAGPTPCDPELRVSGVGFTGFLKGTAHGHFLWAYTDMLDVQHNIHLAA